MQENSVNKYIEKLIKPKSGWPMLFLNLLFLIASILLFAFYGDSILIVVLSALLLLIACLLPAGFKVLGPNESFVMLMFGKYYGTIKKEGFFWLNIFATPFNPAGRTGKKLSLKAMTLDNDKQKVNDLDGNPIEIGVVVIWQIKDTAKAVFNVDNYANFISIQTDATIRNIARQYPYDISDGSDEKSLRGSSQEIADMLMRELDTRVDIAGIDILEARISHLAYSQEIAAAMLQRQQAKAIVDARTTIVEGAVGMVEMALDKLNEKQIVDLDEERKAQMVSNLLVVLCGNKDAQPIVNSGSIY